MKQRRLRIAVRALIKGNPTHGYVWRLLRDRAEVLRDVAPTKDAAERAADQARQQLESQP